MNRKDAEPRDKTKGKYSFMDFMDDFVFGPMNLINRAEGMVRLMIAGDTGVKLSILRMDKGGKHSLREVQGILKTYGIDTFGCTHDSKHLHMIVKKRQSNWAENVLCRAGVAMKNKVINRRNAVTAAKHKGMPTPWANKKGKRA